MPVRVYENQNENFNNLLKGNMTIVTGSSRSFWRKDKIISNVDRN